MDSSLETDRLESAARPDGTEKSELELALAPGPSVWSPANVWLCDVALARVTEAELIALAEEALASGRGGWCVTVNLEILRQVARWQPCLALVQEADLRVADGMTLVWASRLQGTPLPERVCGSNVIWTLSAAAAIREHSIYLLGGAPGTADRAAARLLQRYPGLKVAGTHCPPMHFERDEREMAAIVDDLRRTQPEIVYVALGFPKAEQLIHRIRSVLPGAWWMGVGISFSFVCGDVQRAPRWMQQVGLESLHRLVQEPRRLARRYLIDGPPFALSLLARSAMQREWCRSARRQRGCFGASEAPCSTEPSMTLTATSRSVERPN